MAALLLAVSLMAGNGPTTLYFSGGGGCLWQHVTANGQLLGPVPKTALETAPGCYGMGRLQDGTIWIAAEHHFYTFTGDLSKRSGGHVTVEQMAGSSGRYLYRIRRGPKLKLLRPAVEHVAVLEEIDPKRWRITRAWDLPGTYRSFGLGHLAVDGAEAVAYYSKAETRGIIHRHDLQAYAPLPDLVSRTIGSGGLLVLPDGSVVVGYTDGVQRISADGSYSQTYPVRAIRSAQGLLAHGATGGSFWVQGLADGAPYSTLYEVALDGTIRHQWNTPANGVQWDAPFVDPPPSCCVPAGSIAFSLLDQTTSGAPVAIFLSPTDLSALCGAGSDPATLTGGRGSALDSGVFATDKQFAYAACDIETLADLTTLGVAFHGGTFPQGNYGSLFYQPYNPAGAPNTGIVSFTASPALVNQFPLTLAHNINQVVANQDNDFAYYRFVSSAVGAARREVRRFNIGTSTDLGAWVTEAVREVTISIARNLLVLRNGQVLVGWSGAGATSSVVKRYAADGTELATYVLNASASSEPIQLTADVDDTTFWAAYVGASDRGALAHIRVSDGAVLFSHDVTNAEKFAVDAVFNNEIDWQPDQGVDFVQREDCNCPMACPDPCEDAGAGEPYLALAAEQNTTLFYDRTWNFQSSISTPMACALAPSSEGVWIAMDSTVDAGSILYLVDPFSIDENTNENEIVRGPYTVNDENNAPLRIAELGGFHALFTLDCSRLLTSDRTTHDVIILCLPNEMTGIALVEQRLSLNVTPFDAQLVDSNENILYLDGGSAKLWNITNDALLKTIGTVSGTWPVVLNDNTFLTRDGNEIIRWSRTGTLLHRWNWVDQGTSLSRLYGLAADLQTDICECGNAKDGGIFIPGETPATGITLSVLDEQVEQTLGKSTTLFDLPDVVQGGIDTASAFVAINAYGTGSAGDGFSNPGSGATTRPIPNRHCGPEAGVSSPQPNPGCNAGGKGWIPTYTGASGTTPAASDPSGEETLTGKTDAMIRVKIRHSTGGSPEEEVLTYAKIDIPSNALDLDMHPHAEARVLSIGDDDRGLSDGQGNMISGSTHIQFMDASGRPFGTKLRSVTEKFWTRDELVLEALTPAGVANNEIPRRIGTGLIYGEDYGGRIIFGVTAVDPLFVEGGSFGPDKKVPQWTYPLSYYTNAPADLASVPMPIIYGEVSDEGAISPVTGLPNSRGKCPVRFVGMDTLGTLPGGQAWGRFNICLFPIYQVIALYGSDLGGMGLYGAAATVSVVQASDSPDVEASAETTLVTLDGLPDLSALATDATMQIVLFTKVGRMEAAIIGADPFGRTVTIETPIEADIASGISWYISSIDYVPRRVVIDLDTRNGVDVQVPTVAGYVRPTPYEEFSVDNRVYRVTDMWATGALLSAHLEGEVTLAVNVVGIEDVGDGSGLPFIDYFTAFNHFLDNIVHVQEPSPAGPGTLWPATEADLPHFSDGFSKTKQSTFAAAQAITARALGGRGLQVNAWFGDGISMRDAMQLWIENGGCKVGSDEYGRIYVWMLDRYEDTADWPTLDHVNRVFGEPPHRIRALDEQYNSYHGGCDYDPEGMVYREDDLRAISQPAISRNKGIVKPSKHFDLKLLAYVHNAQWILDRALLVNQDGPHYVMIQGLDYGVLDVPTGSGFFFTSQMLPGSTEEGMVAQPLIVLHRNFDMDTGLVNWLCLDLGQDAEGDALLIPEARRMIATDVDALAPIASDIDSIAPEAA